MRLVSLYAVENACFFVLLPLSAYMLEKKEIRQRDFFSLPNLLNIYCLAHTRIVAPKGDYKAKRLHGFVQAQNSVSGYPKHAASPNHSTV